MRKKYPLSKGGYFGEKGDNKRVVHAENQIKESKKFYTQVSRGGKNKPMSNGRGSQKIMKDGGVVTYREKTSTPNSPAVNLSEMKGIVKNQKIHFEKEKKQ